MHPGIPGVILHSAPPWAHQVAGIIWGAPRFSGGGLVLLACSLGPRRQGHGHMPASARTGTGKRFRRGSAIRIDCVLVVEIWVLALLIFWSGFFFDVSSTIGVWICSLITGVLNFNYDIPGRSPVTHLDCRPRWPQT